jgi:hypothetical protein
MIGAVLEHHAHGTLTQLGGKFAGLHSGSIFSRVGASTKPGAIHPPNPDRFNVLCVGQTLDTVLAASLSARIWRFSTGEQPWGFLPSFKRLLTHRGLLKDTAGSDRTLYNLRHTYAKL